MPAELLAAILLGTTTAMVWRWRRKRQRMRIRIILGLTLIGLSLISWLSFLDTHDVPRDEPYGLGVVPPALDRKGSGFAVAIGVEPGDCRDPVDVTVVAAGTAEYWQDVAGHVPKAARFKVLLPAAETDHVEIGLASDLAALQRPEQAVMQNPRYLSDTGTEPVEDGVVASGVVRNWGARLDPVVVKFRANWIRPRGLFECYVELPGLTGQASVFAAQQARGVVFEDPRAASRPGRAVLVFDRVGLASPYDRRLETPIARATALVDSGQILASESRPGPDKTIAGNPVWTCASPSPLTTSHFASKNPDIYVAARSGGGAYSKRYLAQDVASNCGGVATVRLAQAGIGRDIAVLVIGGLLSMGLALLLDALLDRLTGTDRSRREPRS